MRQSTPTAEPQSDMSDAERVYVLQQFARPAVRMAFLKRVYSIVAVQLLATAGIIGVIRSQPALFMALVRNVGQGLFFLPLLPVFLLSMLEKERTSGSALAYFLLASASAGERMGH